MTEKASPLWCANDTPHDAHSRHNEFNGIDYCTGRPSVTVPSRAAREALADEISGIVVGTGYYSASIGIDAALEAADAILATFPGVRDVIEGSRRPKIVIDIIERRCDACGQLGHNCPTGGRLLR